MLQQKEFLAEVKNVVLSFDDKAELILYGSRARGDFKEDSDWDVLVLTNEKIDAEKEGAIVDRIYEIELKYLQAISTLIVDKAAWNYWEIRPLNKKCCKRRHCNMKADKQELIDVQLQRAQESFTMAELAGEAGVWNSAASELYYAFFNLVRVLFTLDDIDAQTHTGIKSLFSLKFIKEKQLDEKWGSYLRDFSITGKKVIMEI